MKIVTSYSVRLRQAPACFKDTVMKYREAVDWFIGVMESEWNSYSDCNNQMAVRVSERFCVKTAKNESPKYSFSDSFHKFPSYLRRAAIAEAFGLVSSYHSSLDNWKVLPVSERKTRPSIPRAGFVCPAMYRDNCFVRTGTYSARIKVWIHNTWDWVDVAFRKCDVDYILRRCSSRKECVPTLRQRGKVWSLDFSFEERVTLAESNDIESQRIMSVDLGLNNACVCSVMTSDGTVVGRRFLHLPSEYDHLRHCLGNIKHAQQSGAKRMPGLWAKARGVNNDISVKTARFIVESAMFYGVDTIVMEALELNGKKRGSKQRLALWRARYVQSMVEIKAHRGGIRVSRVCAWNSSRLAFDGSGRVMRGGETAKTGGNYSLCEFSNGKVYNCDLNASYNIGARYFIREILRNQSERTRLALTAKVPSLAKRSTCTLSDLKDLRAAMVA
jgi:transposase, IS605 OrfB family, central region